MSGLETEKAELEGSLASANSQVKSLQLLISDVQVLLYFCIFDTDAVKTAPKIPHDQQQMSVIEHLGIMQLLLTLGNACHYGTAGETGLWSNFRSHNFAALFQ